MSFKMLSYLPGYLMKNLLLKMQPCTTEANVCVEISKLQKNSPLESFGYNHWHVNPTLTALALQSFHETISF